MSKINNKNNEYAILYLHKIQKMDAATIAKELKISQKTVDQILATQTSEDQPKKSKVKDLMIRQTASKSTNSVAIMTQGASQQSDEAVKNSESVQKNLPHIFRPNG